MSTFAAQRGPGGSRGVPGGSRGAKGRKGGPRGTPPKTSKIEAKMGAPKMQTVYYWLSFGEQEGGPASAIFLNVKFRKLMKNHLR